MTPDDRPILVTGGAGFIGCNIADRLAGEGHSVLIYDTLSRPGVERNLRWLQERHPSAIQPITAADTGLSSPRKATEVAGTLEMPRTQSQ